MVEKKAMVLVCSDQGKAKTVTREVCEEILCCNVGYVLVRVI